MKKIFILGVLAVTMVAGGAVLGSVSSNLEKKGAEVISEGNNDSFENKDKLSDDTSDSDVIELTVDDSVQFIKESGVAHPSFHTQWKMNEEGSASICIEGKGEDAIEEGEGYVYIKKNGNTIKISMKEESNMYTPVYAEWVSNDEFIVNTAPKHGTVRAGGKIYKLNIDDMTPYLIYEMSDSEKVLETFQIDDDTLNIRTSAEGNTRTYSNGNDVTVKIN